MSRSRSRSRARMARPPLFIRDGKDGKKPWGMATLLVGVLAVVIGCLLLPSSIGSTDAKSADVDGRGVMSDAEEEAVKAAWRRGESVIRVTDWNYEPLTEQSQARRYLTGHPRAGKHYTTLLQSTLEANYDPDGQGGYSYITCAAGGPLLFDNFRNTITSDLTVSRDMSKLTRTFRYSTSAHSVLQEDVIHACGDTLEMQSPAPSLSLPYSDSFDIELTLKEVWRSNRTAEGQLTAESDGTKTVSIEPYDQWRPGHLQYDAKVTAVRGFSHWEQQFGENEMQAVFGSERWQHLKAVEIQTGEHLVAEAHASCKMDVVEEAKRCFDPLTMLSGGPPLISTGIFLEWQQVTWESELPAVVPLEEDVQVGVLSEVKKGG